MTMKLVWRTRGWPPVQTPPKWNVGIPRIVERPQQRRSDTDARGRERGEGGGDRNRNGV